MTANDLERLSHDILVQTVAERLGLEGPSRAAASRYLRNESVPAVRIHPYPRRHGAGPAVVTIKKIAVPSGPSDLTYADFLRIPEVLSTAV